MGFHARSTRENSALKARRYGPRVVASSTWSTQRGILPRVRSTRLWRRSTKGYIWPAAKMAGTRQKISREEKPDLPSLPSAYPQKSFTIFAPEQRLKRRPMSC